MAQPADMYVMHDAFSPGKRRCTRLHGPYVTRCMLRSGGHRAAVPHLRAGLATCISDWSAWRRMVPCCAASLAAMHVSSVQWDTHR